MAFFELVVPPADDHAMSYLRHRSEGNDDMPAYIKAALTQTSIGIPVSAGKALFGTWQGIYLFDHRTSPHRREIVLHLIHSRAALEARSIKQLQWMSQAGDKWQEFNRFLVESGQADRWGLIRVVPHFEI